MAVEFVITVEQKKIAVAMRFVDWFTERGVSYEHNLHVIDKHIGNLVKNNLPQDKLPYSGQIKYTNILKNDIQKVDQLENGRPINNWS